MRRLPLIICLLALIGSAMAAARGNRDTTSREDINKADYLFLEALRARSQDRNDAAYELLERAHALNPADNETALELSRYLLMLPTTDSLDRALTLMGQYYNANPSDYQAGARYGMVLDRMGRQGDALKVWEALHKYYPQRPEVTAVLASALAQTGIGADADRAVALFDSMEVTEGPSVNLSSNKIQIFYNRNDTASILAEVDRLRRLYPTNSEFCVFSGEVYTMFGNPDKALEFYNRACELDPSSGYAYYSKAEYFKNIGDSAGYDREVFVALGRDNLDVNTKLAILRSYIRDMYADTLQQPRIVQLFDTLELQHPLEHDIHALYAAYLLQTGEYARAAEQQEHTLGLDPADPEGWDLLSSLYMQIDDMTRAEDAVKRAMHYYPDNSTFHLKLGSIYAISDKNDMAMAQYERALQTADSTDVNALSSIYTAMGDVLYKKNLPDSAFTLYERAILYNPDNLLALNNCAYFMACSGGDLDKALSMAEKVVEQTPESTTNLDTYAWVLFKRKEYQKAREVIDKALSLQGDEDENAEIYEHAGDIYFMDGDPTSALEFWKKALKLDPDNELLKRKVKNKTFYYE
ncbi:MAG: tetratricopeptide repeat protein [Muribaculaceae bacterium]|nr:tetratricopeptide repeat protein [Muribaculaceae bacterium]